MAIAALETVQCSQLAVAATVTITVTFNDVPGSAAITRTAAVFQCFLTQRSISLGILMSKHC
jgi:hypothetical protein